MKKKMVCECEWCGKALELLEKKTMEMLDRERDMIKKNFSAMKNTFR